MIKVGGSLDFKNTQNRYSIVCTHFTIQSSDWFEYFIPSMKISLLYIAYKDNNLENILSLIKGTL
jgi:hypothetical protein